MDEHVDPEIAARLHRYWPISVAPGTPPAEAELVRGDIAFQQRREQSNDSRALDLQIQAMREAGW